MSIRIDRIVTRGGDGGQTSLGDGTRVDKSSARIEALGAVDEANATIGVLRLHLSPTSPDEACLARMQSLLFDIGGMLCVPENGTPDTEALIDGFQGGDEAVAFIEEATERLRVRQEPLRSFVLPAGSAGAAHAHLARTVVRRAERRVVALRQEDTVSPSLLRCLNRLSDYLFVLARHLNDDGRGDVLWQPNKGP
ncbi:ATP/cobalamin adenosyltransferase [Gluconacetobacter diazotrophicus PA1 5]|uniref:Corrinoid adenosyltransferase n=1 Tax=Gluconacetobacter diazotrophicus TaxID=33996 RepID=A0A7W4I7F6_GLUDI|nr:cob(I)yrinic acid a,c-diamide adenosyltransferase [Gluconacetobacter diazotrophicus]ACI52980.1 ATP/cobalamin adenosyltransferase [Gluconacetobacter diazotrophicus PA1 5]MBB2157674.1 cob(I)yrinic acid a,c-diamide adenosyltransferase [Gluconacetobacter diazotrophicus]TWA98153.1 cob(I)alamin adenosyltransferase [Gluconacetobacter diazotrophicus]